MTTKEIINYTNERLNNWYANAKADYNVDGFANLEIKDDKAVVKYIENGINKKWSMPFYTEYTEFGVDYIFNVWMVEAK